MYGMDYEEFAMDEQIRLECVDEDYTWVEAFSGLLLACSSGFEIYHRADDDRVVLYDTQAKSLYILRNIDELGAYVTDAKCQQIKRALIDQSAWVASAPV
jgi:hypothetical protein